MKDLRQTTTQTAVEGMVLDIDPTLISDKVVSYARNAIINSKEKPNFYQTESANTFCFSTPYPFVGNVQLPDDTQLIMSGDGTNSEIGIANIETCVYTPIVNNTCLGFSPDFPIHGRAKALINGDFVATFTDNNNPVRRINLNQIPYLFTSKDDACQTKEFTKELDCDALLLFKQITPPCLTARRSNGGNLPNGVYAIAIAYAANKLKFSDYYSITTPIFINSETTSGSITVTIDNLDREFDEYQLVLIGDINGSREARMIGTFPTIQSTVYISEFSGIPVPTNQLVVTKNIYTKAGIISGNSETMMLADLTTRPPLNYQPQAFNIATKYVVKQVPLYYYKDDGTDIGYYRNEQYAFYISWLYNTGEYSQEFHIAGRKATGSDLAKAAGRDVYETDKRFGTPPPSLQKWQVENTAQKMVPINNEFSNGERIIGEGNMGYWQSTEIYPNVPEAFLDNACTPIRHHKMPDECKAPRFSTINNVTYVNILGVQFNNIEFPKDADGNKVKDIVGYRIIRADRNGNRTIIARGMATNVRSYQDQQTNQEILYANYPYNSLQVDPYLSQTQTVFKGKRETNYKGLTNFYQDQFNFYSPHTNFDLKYRLGNEIIFETEESGQVVGNFQPTYNHPKLKLLTQAAFWSAIAFAVVETAFEASGQKGKATTSTSGAIEGTALITGLAEGTINFGGITGPGGNTTTNATSTTTSSSSALSAASGGVLDALKNIRSLLSGDAFTIKQAITAFRLLLQLIGSLGATAALFTMTALNIANNVINTIRNLLSPIDYAYQYNSHAFFNQQRCIPVGQKRRGVLSQPIYLTPDNATINEKIFNNFKKQPSVYFQVNAEVDTPQVTDDSLRTISGFGACANPQNNVTSIASMYYVTSQQKNPNQYGPLTNFTPVVTHSCAIFIDTEEDKFQSPVIFGGDCIITPFAIQTKQPMFSQDLSNANFPDEIEYDYRLYRNIGYARYWVDSTKYDFSALLNRNFVNYSTFSRTTTAKYNLDCKFQDGGNVFRVDSSYFYTYVNGVIEFIAEADYNIAFREKIEGKPFYSQNSTDITNIFRSDRLLTQEEFRLNPSYKTIQTRETPVKYAEYDRDFILPTHLPNSLIYSLPSFQALQVVDNWQYFLPANFFTFEQADFGNLTGIHKIDQDRVIFLFDRSSPFISMARSELQIGPQTVTIGDGGLFAQRPREIVPTDINYGACQSKYAYVSTQYGGMYPSESNKKIFRYVGSIKDDSKSGAPYWCQKYMPIQLYDRFPNYPRVENPITGVGYLIAFDMDLEKYYITKRDFLPLYSNITYNPETNQFLSGTLPISLRNPAYFKDISWTISFDPTLNQGQGGFVSFHDWHPDWIIQSENHFLSVEDSTVLKHNSTCTSFCNYNGVDYPYQIEYTSSTGQTVVMPTSIEYILEAYQFRNDCRDYTHIFHSNFDNLIVTNTEQSSGKLNLIESTDALEQSQEYPKPKPTSTDVLYTKVENKYRINQFADITSDRQKNYHQWVTDESGYKQELNPLSIDYQKPEEERKLFRHYLNKFRFIKNVVGNTKILNKINNIKNNLSIR